MTLRVAMACGLLLTIGPVAAAQAPTTAPADEPRPRPTQHGNWWDWPQMTGDWGGLRTELSDKGVTLDFGITQIIQHNARGGRNTHDAFEYSGSADITLKLDTAKMDLWPGGMILLNAEPKWHNGVNPHVGSLIPVNLDAVKPNDDECIMTLSEWFYQQVLFDGKLVLLAGKLDGSRAFDTNAFANDERTQFMNLALRNNAVICGLCPYTTLGVGAIVNPTDWLSIRTAVLDTSGQASVPGFESAFHSPVDMTLLHEWDFKVKPFEREGNYRVGFAWSSKDFPHLSPKSPFRQTAPLLIALLGLDTVNKIAPMLPTKQSRDNVVMYFNFDQWLYQEPEDPLQGIGLFGRFGWAREDVNPIEQFYSIGMGGRGVIPGRDRDTCGLGYYHANLSDEMPPMLHSESGIEMYYNIEITPWLHVSPDLQIIVDPGGSSGSETSIVYGLRMQMSL